VTAVFPAPPEETTELAVLIDGMLPVQVPVQPAGSPTPVDDSVLRASSEGEPKVGVVLCPAVGPADAGGTKKTVIRLPADVLFAFGSAELAPAAQQAIAAVDDQIGSGGTGTVTIEGHTDAIGSDADNQALSQRRAAAVRTALEAELGSGYTYTSVGFGEPEPVAPNTKPDGSDDPDGRALNRRVEIRTGSVEQVPATLESLPVTRDLADAGLRAEVAGLGATLGLSHGPADRDQPDRAGDRAGPGGGLTPFQGDPSGSPWPTALPSSASNPCQMSVGRSGAGSPTWPIEHGVRGERVQLRPGRRHGELLRVLCGAGGRVRSVDVEIGGFGETVPTPVPS
jgi:outer membrane protein OmpA-like peptidoglycan-associated protein